MRTYANPLITPVIQPATALAGPLSRTTKRGTIAINYAEDGYEDYDDDDDEGRRRPTGLRSLRREDSSQGKQDPSDKVGKETTVPVEVQGIYREWIAKGKPAKAGLLNYAQATLPLTLIPIRIDLDIPSYTPPAPIPLPHGTGYSHHLIDTSLPAYRTPETTVPYRLKDVFLWNLHETLTTTDQFAQSLVQDLDLPNRAQMANEISKQIRTQLEEYAGVALHPLFHSPQATAANGTVASIQAGPASRDLSTTPAASGSATPMRNGSQLNAFPSPAKFAGGATPQPEITASATSIPLESDVHNPDDMYRCIIALNINLSNHLYTDRFEWSLLHPPGTAEMFAKQTCADLGLPGEWVAAMTHAIYEAVLRLKKEACESGGLVGAYGNEIANDAANGAEAGWRYDNEHLADEWEPKIEILSKEEIEKREGDRERQIRRVRRETARFSSSTGMMGGTPQGIENRSYFDVDPSEERMGRGERSKKKRRFRSLSPLGRSGTPGGRGTPDAGGISGYGGGGSLNDYERNTWRCAHCKVWGTAVWAVRDGPHGPRVRLSYTHHDALASMLTCNRASATTAASSSSVIASFQNGPKTYTRATCGLSTTADGVATFSSLCFLFVLGLVVSGV